MRAARRGCSVTDPKIRAERRGAALQVAADRRILSFLSLSLSLSLSLAMHDASAYEITRESSSVVTERERALKREFSSIRNTEKGRESLPSLSNSRRQGHREMT